MGWFPVMTSSTLRWSEILFKVDIIYGEAFFSSLQLFCVELTSHCFFSFSETESDYRLVNQIQEKLKNIYA